ncbi:AraC family transcriptional regulator [Azospirillum picis]|uniref:AraC-like DNA-binding protein n=1 Tax=Azospirillum picis TaxID=488438 RepID=A0ABU0MHS5_9PROT|nr:AraC family transcriptional regulator [Azospirillum picis]MBP2299355.1 AraC-like DNA-binding protein [Azospirillum picis]MDQ0533007.1 AraC-like DNA-binding protein [Azospirillum picis]
MPDALLDAVRRYADAHADRSGIVRTPVSGLTLLRETTPSALQYAISQPLVALVLQGSKRVAMGDQTFDFSAGESLLITTDVPTVSQITRASVVAPYYALVVDLNPAVIADLVAELGPTPSSAGAPVRVDLTDAEVADAAHRLIRLLDRPAHLSVLQTQLMRELHVWLLTGRHGGAIRALGVTDGHARRIARAVAIIRAGYATTLRVERLAEAAGMSPSSFHEHFRAITSLTPLQFQKRLRLIEARRMLIAEGVMIGTAAYAVGYESVPQFTRDYGRLFGLPPARDVRAAKQRMRPAPAVTGDAAAGCRTAAPEA